MLDLFLQAGFVIFVLVTILWIISVFIKNASIVDLFWGLGFVVVNGVYFYLKEEFFTRDIIILILVSIWGLRLSGYLSWRNIGKGEDFRYQEFRRKYGVNRFWWISYFQTFILQGVLIMIVSLPLLGTNYSTNGNELIWLDYLAVIVYIIGLSFEAGGDIQLAKFKSNAANKGKVLNTGFWKYTRHPNYFGDSAVWWSFGLLSIAAGNYWTFIGSVFMTLLIIKVSGVALLEKTLKTDKPQYAEYIKNTNSFFPWFPKK